MNPALSPVAGLCIIIMGLLFVSLFMAWCCKQCSQSKQIIAPLLSPYDPLYNRQYMTAIDVQTGLPVIIQSVGRNSRNLVRVTSVATDGRHAINSGPCGPMYGSIVHGTVPQTESISRTPPPPYSSVCIQTQPRV